MKLFVWDFHGVLERNTESSVLIISNEILKKEGYKERMDKEQIEKLFGRRWYQYFEEILPYESHERHWDLAYMCFKMSEDNPDITAKYLKSTPYAKSVLKKLGKKHEQILVSNTSKKLLKRFIEAVKIDDCFNEKCIFSSDSNRGEKKIGKKQIIEDYIKGKKYNEIVLIGDSLEEMNIAKDLGAKFYMFAHKNKAFRDGDYGKKIRDLRDVLKEL